MKGTSPLPFSRLIVMLKNMDGFAYNAYQRLFNQRFKQNKYTIHFKHIQKSPGAFPASVITISTSFKDMGLPPHSVSNDFRKLATADYILRGNKKAVDLHARQNRGSNGSGSFQPPLLPPQILRRNVVRLAEDKIHMDLRISLPGSLDNRVMTDQALSMFERELPDIINFLKDSLTLPNALKKHCDTVEDFYFLQNKLEQLGLVAFIGDGSMLGRQSGISQLPLENGVYFTAPDDLAQKVLLPNAGTVRGLAILPGVTVLIGSGFQGKSTLLNAMAKGVYPHIPGDGRELVVTHAKALYISSEEGRSIKGVNISTFVPDLPGQTDPACMDTQNASSSISQAAAVVEAVWAGARFLLLDEDTSAANFLIRDKTMRRLLPEDQSTPFYDHVKALYTRFKISTLIIIGASSQYLASADHVIAMKNYQPVDYAPAVDQLALDDPSLFSQLTDSVDHRQIMVQHLDPSYMAKRLDKTIALRIKPLRMQDNILEYGNQRLDLRPLAALVDTDQALAIGYALYWMRNNFSKECLTPADLACAICQRIEKEGLDLLQPEDHAPLFLAAPRSLELTGAINRIRNLVYKVKRV